MKVLNLLTGGRIGGIETLCFNWGKYAKFENGFVFLTELGAIYDEMVAANLVTYDLTESKHKISIKKLIQLVKISKKYDIIIVHHEDPILRMYYIALSKCTNCRFVSYIHSCYGDYSQVNYGFFKNRINRLILQKAFDVSDIIISVSEAGVESFKKIYHVSDNKCQIIYNGISKKIYDEGLKNIVLDTPPYRIVYIGRLEKIKGVDLLIEAFKYLKERYDVTLDIVGGGKEAEQLEERAMKYSISGEIHFWGEKTDIKEYLKKANIFVYPSVCEEVFGISLVEALAFGIPCVANRVGGIPEIVIDGINGTLTDEMSAVGISTAIERLIIAYQSGEIKKYSFEAKRTAERFTIEKNCNRVYEILSTIE